MSRGRLLLALKILAALCAGVVTLGVSLYSADVWKPSEDRLLLWLALATVVPLVSSTATAVREYLGPQREGRREAVGQLLRTAFFQIWRATKIAPEEVGIAAYELKRRMWCWPPFMKHKLVRLYRDRARNRLNTSGVNWAPGKGIIGLAVSEQQFVAGDLGEAWDGLENCSAEEWDSQSPSVRQGLSHGEFKKLHDKHGAVAAMPIIDGEGKVWGCVAVDGPHGCAARLESKAVQGHLADAGSAIYLSVLKPAR